MVANSVQSKELLIRATLDGHISKGVWALPTGFVGLVRSFLLPTGLIKTVQMYKKIPVKKLTGKEEFKNASSKHFSVLEFWQYGFSSLNSNVLRGALAEFIVENALKGDTKTEIRSPWGDYDVLYKGKKIEVKSCSYIQDWDQTKLSTIKWSGLKAKELYYSEAVKKYSDMNTGADYKSDIYVLALLKNQDPTTLDILDINQWCFYVLSKDELRTASKNRGSISLVRLQKLSYPEISFNQLANTINK